MNGSVIIVGRVLICFMLDIGIIFCDFMFDDIFIFIFYFFINLNDLFW